MCVCVHTFDTAYIRHSYGEANIARPINLFDVFVCFYETMHTCATLCERPFWLTISHRAAISVCFFHKWKWPKLFGFDDKRYNGILVEWRCADIWNQKQNYSINSFQHFRFEFEFVLKKKIHLRFDEIIKLQTLFRYSDKSFHLDWMALLMTKLIDKLITLLYVVDVIRITM